jgi:arsenate reductase
LIDYIQDKKNRNQQIRLNFICIHNSHQAIAQIWAQVAAAYYDVPNVTCYSGGTEATALFSSVVFALEKHGFKSNLYQMPIINIQY